MDARDVNELWSSTHNFGASGVVGSDATTGWVLGTNKLA